ncbi:putative reverse transcriptase domain-containing protein [Tanacetum coccineum]|uniref:Reverse transcriptase domain-containing protein n=1 Tax=Tanacetum coccineum TaxID=301880 RepID=A0ABQ5EEI9_9ASTR
MSSSPHSTIIPSDSNIEDTFSSTNILNYFLASSENIFPNSFEKISSPKGTETPISPSLSVGSSSPIRSTTPPPDYLFDESIFVKLDNSLWIISRPLGSEPVPEESNESNAWMETITTRTKKYHGNLPLCTRCTLHHTGVCTVKCQTCNKVGHLTRNCRSKGPATGSNLLSVSVTCHAYGEKGHYKNQCSKIDNSTFYVSKKCLCDESLVIPMKEIWLDDKLNFVEEPVEIMDREVKQLRQKRIPIVKVRCNSKFTWEREDQIRAKYPHLFSNTTPSSN